jgi:hypothetical protein
MRSEASARELASEDPRLHERDIHVLNLVQHSCTSTKFSTYSCRGTYRLGVVIFSMLAHTETMSLLYDEKWYSCCRLRGPGIQDVESNIFEL